MRVNASASNNLLVDFPSSPSHAMVKTVRFAPAVDGQYIRYPTQQENRSKWYNRDDKAHFDRAMIRDALKVSRKVQVANSTNPRDVAKFEKLAIECVGLDRLISHDVYRSYQGLRHVRKEHARIVLEVQEEYGHIGDASAYRIACVAKESSSWSRDRARKVAMLAASIK